MTLNKKDHQRCETHHSGFGFVFGGLELRSELFDGLEVAVRLRSALVLMLNSNQEVVTSNKSSQFVDGGYVHTP
jgi:hypothetical protein